METDNQASRHVSPIIRLAILLLGLIGLIIVSYILTGTIFPSDNRQANIFQNGLLLVVLGSLFLEDKFTRPVDALINGLTGAISLLTVISTINNIWWSLIFGYCILIFLSALLSIALGVPLGFSKFKDNLSNSLYRFSTQFGNSRILFTIIFLFSVFSYYGFESYQARTLVLFWGIYIAIWPLRIPHFLQSLVYYKEGYPERCGTTIRFEDPDLIFVELRPSVDWSEDHLFIANAGENEPRVILPLFSFVQSNRLVGAGLCMRKVDKSEKKLLNGGVYRMQFPEGNSKEEVKEYFKLQSCSLPIGLIAEGSTIGVIKFEIFPSAQMAEGILVFSMVNGKQVIYQVIEGSTRNEEFASNLHGFVVAEAIQLGTLDPNKGFAKFDWLPCVNSPVFLVSKDNVPEITELSPQEFILGHTLFSDLPIVANIDDLRSHHLAILGTTGRGKTELAYSLIEESLKQGTRVLCVDLSLQYNKRLHHLGPTMLNIDEDDLDTLDEKILAAETGEYGGGKEKKLLHEHIISLRSGIEEDVSIFLADEKPKLGLFVLPSITNSRSTIQITEIYLSAVFNYAKAHLECKPIWIVLEEAHTIAPEASFSGSRDYPTQALIEKISQIALQGRKYNVGLMVIAQRTATVSKTVLTQCNSVISFSMYDETGLKFLANYLGSEYTSIVPNLGFLQVIAFGKGIKSARPIIVEIPKKELAN